MTESNSPEFKISTIDGPNGAFGIATAGAQKEGLRYLYHDEKRSVFFYADIESTPKWTVTVPGTSGVHASAAEWNRLAANIEFFFKTRHYRYPDKAVTKGAEAQVVKFENWGVTQ